LVKHYHLLKNAKNYGIEYEVDDKLSELIVPNLYIDEIEQVPNKEYIYRDYQERLLQALCMNR
jgi:hypothetical protein